ncbi:MAG: AAA family ATPase [Crocinitomicaceae bacterium]|nr:AAA family ATPase [Crocinitomicaceae bacterium]MDG1777425.1 AAA family ATPase [Crocinitomicaceae bacterium]
MSEQTFYSTLLAKFEMEPTTSQSGLFDVLEQFLRRREGKQVLIIRGYAGTGKTSVLAAFVKTLKHYRVKTKLLAPTGRAAKVFSHKSGEDALTIHKQIYRRKSKVDLNAGMSLSPNLFKNMLFLVDEASMIGDFTLTKDGNVNARNLLEDLFEYVFSGDRCKLILIGDDGQLPPVGSDYSPALNKTYLEHNFFSLNVETYQLNEVVRQANDSEILRNATVLRNTSWNGFPKFDVAKNADLKRISGMELQDYLEASYGKNGMEDTIVITRSNKQANNYNQQIRGRILWYEETLCSGECLMVVKNNYFWLGDDTRIGFIANGELIRVRRVVKTELMYGFEFAHVIVNFVDYESLGDIEMIVHLESLLVEGPSLSRGRMKALFFAVEQDYIHEKVKKKRYEAILADPYFNALQVKYAYAVTCHKSQGGQWTDVYIDQGFITEETMGSDYYRWLYTSLTRATGNVYLVNFSDKFFAGELDS